MLSTFERRGAYGECTVDQIAPSLQKLLLDAARSPKTYAGTIAILAAAAPWYFYPETKAAADYLVPAALLGLLANFAVGTVWFGWLWFQARPKLRWDARRQLWTDKQGVLYCPGCYAEKLYGAMILAGQQSWYCPRRQHFAVPNPDYVPAPVKPPTSMRYPGAGL